MEQLNRVELRGTVGTCRLQTINERRNANFSLVTNFAYQNQEGVAVIDTTWHNVTAWEGKNIRNIEKIARGEKLYVEGRIRNRSYTAADGTDRQVTEIVATKVCYIDAEEPFQYEM